MNTTTTAATTIETYLKPYEHWNYSMSYGECAATRFTSEDYSYTGNKWVPLIKDDDTATETVNSLIQWDPLESTCYVPFTTADQLNTLHGKLDDLYIIHECLCWQTGDVTDLVRDDLIERLEWSIDSTARLIVSCTCEMVLYKAERVMGWDDRKSQVQVLEILESYLTDLDELDEYEPFGWFGEVEDEIDSTLRAIRDLRHELDPEF